LAISFLSAQNANPLKPAFKKVRFLDEKTNKGILFVNIFNTTGKLVTISNDSGYYITHN
jgi:hypothetical protein